nr:hypothetical protein CFP56_51250 [Quercus suber]
MMTRYSGVSYEAPFDEVSACDLYDLVRISFGMGLHLGTDTLAKTALLLAKPPSSKSRKGKKEQAIMSPSHQFQSTKNPSSTTIVVQKRGTKRSSDMQYEDTLVVSYDDASKDSDANWKHIRKSSKGSSTMTLADHVLTLTHNEPSVVNLETKKHRVDNAITSPKPVNDTNKVSSQQERGMSMKASSRKESLDAKLQITNSEIDALKAKLAELEQLVPQIKSKQVEEDGIIEALQDQLKSIKSTTVLKDQDVEALKKIQSTLESKRFDLKNLKWLL